MLGSLPILLLIASPLADGPVGSADADSLDLRGIVATEFEPGEDAQDRRWALPHPRLDAAPKRQAARLRIHGRRLRLRVPFQ